MNTKKNNRKRKNANNLIRVIIYLVVLINIFNIARNYEINDNYVKNKINILIDNNNVTRKLSYDVFVNEKNVIYMSIQDIASFFDKTISYERISNQVITKYGEKEVELPINKNIITINSRKVNVLSGAVEKNNIYYIPISVMKNIYEIDIEYINEEGILLIDSLTKRLVKADISKKCNVKYKATQYSKTVDKLDKADKVICIEKLENNWTKIRTKNGIIGYVRTKILHNEVVLRDNLNNINK